MKYKPRLDLTEAEMDHRISKSTKEMFGRLGTAALVAVVFEKDPKVILGAIIAERDEILRQDVQREIVQQRKRSIQRLDALFSECSKETTEE